MNVLIGLARAGKVLIHVHVVLKASRAKLRTLRLEEVIITLHRLFFWGYLVNTKVHLKESAQKLDLKTCWSCTYSNSPACYSIPPPSKDFSETIPDVLVLLLHAVTYLCTCGLLLSLYLWYFHLLLKVGPLTGQHKVTLFVPLSIAHFLCKPRHNTLTLILAHSAHTRVQSNN